MTALHKLLPDLPKKEANTALSGLDVDQLDDHEKLERGARLGGIVESISEEPTERDIGGHVHRARVPPARMN